MVLLGEGHDSSSSSSSTQDDSHRYIFQESDFEDDNFNAASFVARFRRVAPLDSLKDQLRIYSAGLKQQLYEIINRDYTNFIKIATKVLLIILYLTIIF
jgi:hypothetical protein